MDPKYSFEQEETLRNAVDVYVGVLLSRIIRHENALAKLAAKRAIALENVRKAEALQAKIGY